MNEIASFTEYATKNCINSQNIYCSCKKCSNRVFLRPEVNSPNIASHTRSLNDTDVDLGTRDLIMEAIGLNVPIHDKDEFIHMVMLMVEVILIPLRFLLKMLGEPPMKLTILWMIVRWVLSTTKGIADLTSEATTTCSCQKPVKFLRYFPLIPRLKKLFKSSKIVASMTWHNHFRVKDELLRHPVDAEAWKDFDERFLDFTFDPHNVHLGFASDDFNSFRTMSTIHSTSPVVLIPYNMDPWTCMKVSSLMLSMIILGEKGHGNDFDIYLQPLINELEQIWNGINVFDAKVPRSMSHVQYVQSQLILVGYIMRGIHTTWELDDIVFSYEKAPKDRKQKDHDESDYNLGELSDIQLDSEDENQPDLSNSFLTLWKKNSVFFHFHTNEYLKGEKLREELRELSVSVKLNRRQKIE
ncbi:hypothetical protein Gotri_002816 [Gossypium trilobum]|uniref:Transposase-associated domain-containing protein n=1 Tax=Gossypium trilobum TaxID=34281 RepID=A0A7J9FBJ0_9ROSI|nr:hypothetical protein [Gossypium trilobum]